MAVALEYPVDMACILKALDGSIKLRLCHSHFLAQLHIRYRSAMARMVRYRQDNIHHYYLRHPIKRRLNIILVMSGWNCHNYKYSQ